MENANPGRPEGEEGRKMLERMNRSHAYLRAFGLPLLPAGNSMRILDVGCGGGATIRDLLERIPESRIDGIDYSGESVALSRELNQKDLGTRVEIKEGSVDSLPYADGTFDLVSAVETVYFWKNPGKAFSEIARVLKQGGTFAILSEASDPLLHTDWPDPEGMITIYRPGELRTLYAHAGFADVKEYRGPGDSILMLGTRS